MIDFIENHITSKLFLEPKYLSLEHLLSIFFSIACHEPIWLWQLLIFFLFATAQNWEKCLIGRSFLISLGDKKLLYSCKYSKIFSPWPIGICLGKCHETYIQHSNFVITKLADEMHRTFALLLSIHRSDMNSSFQNCSVIGWNVLPNG